MAPRRTRERDASADPEMEIPHEGRERSGVRGGFWTLAGAACTALGLALAFAGPLSPSIARAAQRAADAGFHSGVLVMGGLLLVACGSLWRRTSRSVSEETERQEDSQILEQVATDLVQMRGAVDRLQLVSNAVQDDLRSMYSALDAQSQAMQGGSDGAQHDALFRLAASLDQLGARLEQRLVAQSGSLQQTLDQVGITASQAQRALEELAVSAAARAPVELPAAEPQWVVPVATPPDDLAGAEHAQPAPAPPSLGLLDQLDDYGTPAAPLALESTAAPLPSGPRAGAGSWEEELEMVASERAKAAQEELDTQTKLLQLGSLLSDERLRSALEQMRGAGRYDHRA
ncbi:MAG TPA: hypothetical protein VMS76_19100 [Planctomycetota bacterium]|nr:hypothetical protein [Planctomycetota bacterium]